ncbi:conserved Plasmodium protein, unknown function [Plasmodium gallinaceum]|uniref:OTU domain-containing protein n=1 Tax=Plasmodium gallinaceum TaxID=5849 RepID=A0A1J1GW18_PLAGA|nr:conserved Plasmodium protein, unknown function [Plasmodium gallinaceum]CRG95212.1 conserved Plasmodium protein, unknown function [Plasmodium gallinaceum]
MSKKKVFFFFCIFSSLLIYAYVYSISITHISNEKEKLKLIEHNDANVSIAVFNLSNEMLYVDQQHFTNIKKLQHILIKCLKSEKKHIIDNLGIESIKFLLFEYFKKEMYNNLTLFFQFIKNNFHYLNKTIYVEKKRYKLSPKDYIENDKLLDLLEKVMNFDKRNNAIYLEKLYQFKNIMECFYVSISMNLENEKNPIVLYMKIDDSNNYINIKIDNNLLSKSISNIKEKESLYSDKTQILPNLLDPLRTNNLTLRMPRNFKWPLNYFRNLCVSNNYKVASENWVNYFYNHNETLCHIETCGSGDCLFLTLEYLLNDNEIATDNIFLNENIKESEYIKWYIKNIKLLNQKKFNVIDLRYITTYFFIKYFPGYSNENDIDESYINEKLDLLINLEFINYYLKKDLIFEMIQNKNEKKNIKEKSFLSTISDFLVNVIPFRNFSSNSDNNDDDYNDNNNNYDDNYNDNNNNYDDNYNDYNNNNNDDNYNDNNDNYDDDYNNKNNNYSKCYSSSTSYLDDNISKNLYSFHEYADNCNNNSFLSSDDNKYYSLSSSEHKQISSHDLKDVNRNKKDITSRLKDSIHKLNEKEIEYDSKLVNSLLYNTNENIIKKDMNQGIFNTKNEEYRNEDMYKSRTYELNKNKKTNETISNKKDRINLSENRNIRDYNEYNNTESVNLERKNYDDEYESILDDIDNFGYRIYELIFFKIVSLSDNKLTLNKLRKLNKKSLQELKGTNLKVKVIGSHVFMKNIEEGNILPFYNSDNIKDKLNNPFSEENYANKDLYVIILKTTFGKNIKRKSDGIISKSLLLKHDGDSISYWSIKNNKYHFTSDNKVIQTSTIQEKASALFYERTRTGHIHWGDEIDYDAFQKMFNIGLITFINGSTEFFFSKDTFKEYELYFLIYFYSDIHFEPGVHITIKGNNASLKSAYKKNKIPHSFLEIVKK